MEKVKYKVGKLFGSEKPGTIIDAYLIYKDHDRDRGLLFHRAGNSDECCSIEIAAKDQNGYWQSLDEFECYINLDPDIEFVDFVLSIRASKVLECVKDNSLKELAKSLKRDLSHDKNVLSVAYEKINNQFNEQLREYLIIYVKELHTPYYDRYRNIPVIVRKGNVV